MNSDKVKSIEANTTTVSDALFYFLYKYIEDNFNETKNSLKATLKIGGCTRLLINLIILHAIDNGNAKSIKDDVVKYIDAYINKYLEKYKIPD